MVNNCTICTKRVLSHSSYFKCASCECLTHLRCLPTCNSDHAGNHAERAQSDLWLCTTCSEAIFPFNHLTDDQEYISAVSDSQQVPCHNNNPILSNSLEFSPFMMNDDNIVPHLSDIDPDLQFFNDTTYLQNVLTCDYHHESSFNSKLHSLGIDDTSFSMMHLNIRSIPKNLCKFQEYLSNLNIQFSVIGISETWLKHDNANFYGIDGYNHHFLVRGDKTGGGLSLFIKDSISIKLRTDLCKMESSMEALFIEIPKTAISTEKNIIIGVIYRPPNQDIKSFCEKLEEIISHVKCEEKILYLMGDFNINIINHENHLATAEFMETIYSQFMLPFITKPTRIAGNSATLIDNIFSNNISNNGFFNGLLVTDVSDHLPIFTINYNLNVSPPAALSRTRSLSDRNIQNFKNKLSCIDWSNVMQTRDGKEAFSIFHEQLVNAYDAAFPLTNVKHGYTNRKTWLSNGMKNSIKIKNRLYIKQLKDPSVENIKKYKEYKSVLNKTIKESERSHYQNVLNENRKNTRKMWAILKTIINKKKTNQVPDQFIIDNHVVTNKQTIAKKFNQFFTNVGKDLAKKIPTTSVDPLTYLKHPNPHTIYLHDVTENEVIKLITNLKNSSPGNDAIHAKVFKTCFPQFLEPLVHVLNLSIQQGFFPNEMKIAKIIPIYKSNDPTNIGNYRPISVLPLISKLLERIMYNRLISFIDKHQILYKYQFGFRRNHNANQALIILMDKLMSAIDDGKRALGVFLDFKKAFDTVDHIILLKKLEYYGIRGIAHDWLTDYLKDRKQYVSFDQSISDPLLISCGVPQGSILGPLLFILYINDICNISDISFPILFADDTSLFFTGDSISEVCDKANTELTKIMPWIHANKLSLNVSKTHYMFFQPSARLPSDIPEIMIEQSKLERVCVTKFLGINLDSKMTWEKHIHTIKGKVARGLGLISKAKKVLNSDSLVTLYYSMVYSHLIYCVEVWGNAAEIHLNSLLKVQKKVIKNIKSLPYRAPSRPVFKDLNILTITQIHQYHILIFVFKYLKDMLPITFHNFYKLNRSVIYRETRSSNNLFVKFAKTSLYGKSVRIWGARLWNERCTELETKCSIHSFKKMLKRQMIAGVWN